MRRSRLIILALILAPIAAWAAVDSQNKRQSAAGYFEVPDGAIDTAAERKAAAGYYGGLDSGDSVSSTGSTSTGGGIHILKRKRRQAE